MTTIEQRIFDYTNKDYSSLLASLLNQAAMKMPEWTDRSENDLGRLLLELFAYVGDTLLYYTDRIANEAFLETAVERRSVMDLLSLIGYTLGTPSPASAEIALTIPNDDTTPVQINVGARFATEAIPGNPAKCWDDIVPEFRERFYDCFDAVAPKLAELDDPLIRMNLVRFAELDQPKERELLGKMAENIDAESDPVTVKRLAQKHVTEVDRVLRRRTLPEALRAHVSGNSEE